jgi:beta-galactosidase
MRKFDITRLVRPENNVIAVRVHQWSAGSYLEDQDMWWLSGIFRGVTLINEPAGLVGDFFVHADYDADRGAGLLTIDTDRPAFPDFWRAPTDNDVRVAGAWRRAGLDRLERKILSVRADADALGTRLRIAPPGAGFGLLATLTWTADGRLLVHVTPDGTWSCPLPKVGLRLVLDAAVEVVSWFGRGPGEAYRDTYHATRFGRYTARVGELETRYVRPQENGNRMHARNLTLTAAGRALTVTADPHVDFAVRRWSPEALTAARHPPDLVPDGRTYLHLDAAHHGIGSASCGPPLPPGHRLTAHTVAYALRFSI